MRRTRSVLPVALTLLCLLTAACGSNGGRVSGTAVPLTQSAATRGGGTPDVAGAPAATAAVNAPSATPMSAGAAYPVTVKRSDGKDLVIAAQPRRIASLSAGTTEILYAIGGQAQIVATDTHSDYPEAAKNTPKFDGFQPSAEAITGSSPDLVLLVDDRKQIVETLDGLGIPVLYLTVPNSLNSLLQQIELYGVVSGHPLEARQLASDMRTRIDAVQRNLTDAQKGPRVYHEVDPKLFSAAPGSFIGDLYTILKAQNIVPPGSQAYPQLTQEFIISMDPELIILGDTVSGETPNSVKGRPGWSGISAVKNNRVYSIDTNLVSRPGPRIVDALEILATILHPDKF